MKKIFSLLILPILILQAETFNVSTTEEFRTALSDAAQNGEDDTIILADGTYKTTDDGEGTFEYLDNEVYDLTIKGSSAKNVILDGNEEDRIFRHTSIDKANLYLEKLTFKNGGYENSTDLKGGGFLVVNAAVTINDCIFTNNQAYIGGGFAMGDTSNNLNITNTVFENNVAGSGGGGSFCNYEYYSNDYKTIIKDSKFSNNISFGGGGGFTSKYVTIKNSIFYKNKAVHGHGGGFFTEYAEVSDCNFTENSAHETVEPYDYREGGGFYAYQNGSVNNSIFIKNTAGSKGGGFLVRGYLQIVNSSLIGNTLLSTLTTAAGAGLNGGIGIVSNCIIKDNHTYGIGGGLFFNGIVTNSIIASNYAKLRGGGLNSQGGNNLYVANTIFIHNNSSIALYGGTVENPNIIKNSIFVDINDSIIEASFGEPIVNIKNNYINFDKVSSDLQVISSDNNNSTILGFVDQVNEDYHLTASSDLIDAGTNDFADKFIVDGVNYLDYDYDENNRSVGASMDIGMYEYSTTKPTIKNFTFSSDPKTLQEISFTVDYTLASGREIDEVLFDYANDGIFTTETKHIFTKAKTYRVTVKVLDKSGEFSLRTIDVLITALPYEEMDDTQRLLEATNPLYYDDIVSIIEQEKEDAIVDAIVEAKPFLVNEGQQYVIDNLTEFGLVNKEDQKTSVVVIPMW